MNILPLVVWMDNLLESE